MPKPINQDRLQELIDALDRQGSANDPIELDGLNTTPQDLLDLTVYTSLHKKFKYWGVKGKRSSIHANCYGTLIQMVRDRGGDPRHKPEMELKPCPYCGCGDPINRSYRESV